MKSNKLPIHIINQYNQPVLFYGLSTIIPWVLWLSAGYISHLVPYQNNYTFWSIFLALIGLLAPAIVSFFLIIKNNQIKKDVMQRFFNLKDISIPFGFISFFLMPLSILLAQVISLLFGYDVSQFYFAKNFSFSTGMIPSWVLLIVAPFIEELAWHTYGTDCLTSRLSLIKASLLFAVFWGIWHIPLSTIKDTYQSNTAGLGWMHSLNFLVSIVPFVIIMNWIYYKTGRNILLIIVFHITAGLFNEIFSTHPDVKIIQTLLLSVFSVWIVLKNKALFFSNYNYSASG